MFNQFAGPAQVGYAEDFDDYDDFDDFDDDVEFGAGGGRIERRIAKLTQQIARLQGIAAGLPVGARRRRAKIARKIQRKNAALQRLYAKVAAANAQNAAIQAAGASAYPAVVGSPEGAAAWATTPTATRQAMEQLPGLHSPQQLNAMLHQQAELGQRFVTNGPPGSGRLVPMPFYAPTSSGNPRNALTVPVAGVTANTQLETEEIPWAVFRIVGFEAKYYTTFTGALGMVSDLKIGGGTNLFFHDNPCAADAYDPEKRMQAGLRDYPVLRSPNKAFVDVSASGNDSDVVVIFCQLICDVLQDSSHGSGVPGPYAG